MITHLNQSINQETELDLQMDEQEYTSRDLIKAILFWPVATLLFSAGLYALISVLIVVFANLVM